MKKEIIKSTIKAIVFFLFETIAMITALIIFYILVSHAGDMIIEMFYK